MKCHKYLLFLIDIVLVSNWLISKPIDLTPAMVNKIAATLHLTVEDPASIIEIINSQQASLPKLYAQFKAIRYSDQPIALEIDFLKIFERALKKAFACEKLPPHHKKNCNNVVKLVIEITKYYPELLQE